MRILALVLVLLATPAFAQEPDPTPETTPVPEIAAEVASPAPAIRRTGWTTEVALLNQAIFDPGFALFSGRNVIPGVELRARRDLLDAGWLRIAPEASYGFARPRRSLGDTETEMWLSRASAGGRVSVSRPSLPALRAFARAGVMGLHGTALVHDPHRDHREEGFGAGAYASGGAEIDAGVLVPGRSLHFALEAGHAYSPGMDFGRMGTLTIDGAFWSASAAVRF